MVLVTARPQTHVPPMVARNDEGPHLTVRASFPEAGSLASWAGTLPGHPVACSDSYSSPVSCQSSNWMTPISVNLVRSQPSPASSRPSFLQLGTILLNSI